MLKMLKMMMALNFELCGRTLPEIMIQERLLNYIIMIYALPSLDESNERKVGIRSSFQKSC
jgi:hypothetical protein